MTRFFEPKGPAGPDEPEPKLAVKVAWFVVLMLAGLLTVASAAYILRALLFLG